MFKKIETVISLVLGDLIYLISYFVPKDRSLWVFGAWFGEKYADNSKYLFEYVNEKHPEIRAVWLTKNKESFDLISKKGYEVYLMNSIKGYKICLRANKAIISTGIKDILPCTSSRIKIIQLWHGSPLKKIMFDDEFTFAEFKSLKSKIYQFMFPFILRKEFNEKTIFISSSEEVKNIFSSAFKIPKKNIKITGYPRNDFSDPITETRIKKFYNKFKYQNMKIGIYLPTHRKNGERIIECLYENLDFINSSLEYLNSILLIKFHFYGLKDNMEKQSHWDRIIFLKDDDFDQDIYQILPHTDYLITDYSSVYFDYLLLNKPIIFAPFDIKEYLMDDRKFYYDYSEVTPGPRAKNWDELINFIEEAIYHPDKYEKDREIIRKRFNKYNDKENCKRVFEIVANMK